MSLPACSRIVRLSTLLLLAPALMAADCKKQPDDDPDDISNGDVQQVDNPLAVVSIDPSIGKTGRAFPATVYGSGFEPGASLLVGTSNAKASVMDANTLNVTVPSLKIGTYDLVVTNPSGDKSTLRSALRIEAESMVDCSFARVYFGFDQATLATDSQKALDDYMGCYTATTAPIRLEGHADERGTTDYNLALGTRRAHAVQRHLTAAGISSSRVNATSYGEEKPLDRGHSESAWGKNRRVDVYVGN